MKYLFLTVFEAAIGACLNISPILILILPGNRLNYYFLPFHYDMNHY